MKKEPTAMQAELQELDRLNAIPMRRLPITRNPWFLSALFFVPGFAGIMLALLSGTELLPSVRPYRTLLFLFSGAFIATSQAVLWTFPVWMRCLHCRCRMQKQRIGFVIAMYCRKCNLLWRMGEVDSDTPST